MSKYNLIDIYEEYQIGSGWTRDFDYDGMLKAGLKTGVDTDLELLKKMVEDYTDVNYHREAHHLYNAIEALEQGAIKEASMFFGDFHAEIENTMKEQGMDIEPTVGKFMASKMDLDEDKYDDIVDADDDIPADEKKAAAAAYRKVDKGASYEKATSHIKEVTSREGSRIESLLDQRLKAKFLDIFADLYFDLTDEDLFQAEDVVDYLGIEMLKHLDNIQAPGDRLNSTGNPSIEFTPGERIGEEESVEEGVTKDDIKKALKDDVKATDSEIKQYMASVKKAGDKFDDVDDYVEDFKNYVADKSLQEHFGRFLKDYQ